jgi:hypothetical protein
MYDIKYFFLNKINQTIREGEAKKFSGGQITEKYCFSKSRGAAASPSPTYIRPC